MDIYNLKNKMDDWGPFEDKECRWLLFSVGNPWEGHGLALPKAIDDFHAKTAARDLEMQTGQRYVGHIPYTTDRAGSVAKDWAPFYIPWEDFLKKCIDYMKYHIDIIKKRGEVVSNVMLLTGHGGNDDLTNRKIQKEIQNQLEVKKFVGITALVSRKQAGSILEEVKKLAEEIISKEGERFGYTTKENLTDFYTKILLSAGHASHTEHSLGAALGLCDMHKVARMNKLLEKNFEKALKKWPPIGGLGGYLLAGGKYTDALGTEDDDKFGLWNCLNGLKTINNGKLVIAPELGHLIHRIGLETKKEIINKYLYT